MNEAQVKTYKDFVLPPTVVAKSDVSHLVSEFEKVDNELTAAAIRTKTGTGENKQPVLSQQLTDFLVQNKPKVATSQDRGELIKQLRLLKDNVPVMHMTFAVQTDPESLQQLVQWLRTSPLDV